MGIARDDKPMRQDWVLRGFRQFDAPVSLVLAYDRVLDPGAVVSFRSRRAVLRHRARRLGPRARQRHQRPGHHALRHRARGRQIFRRTRSIMTCVAMGYPDDEFRRQRRALGPAGARRFRALCGVWGLEPPPEASVKIVDLSRETLPRQPDLSRPSADHPRRLEDPRGFVPGIRQCARAVVDVHLDARPRRHPHRRFPALQQGRPADQRISAGELHRAGHLHRSAPHRAARRDHARRSCGRGEADRPRRCRRAAPCCSAPAITSAPFRARNMRAKIPA